MAVLLVVLGQAVAAIAMDTIWKTMIGQQLGAAIDMLENAVRACPEHLWGDRGRKPEFWYTVYHTLFFLDLYSSGSVEGFAPPAPFDLGELEPDVLPNRVYTKDELLGYLAHGRAKCRAAVATLTDEQAHKRCRFEWVDVSEAELFLYNMRHLQHHAGQLNLLLRQAVNSAPRWVSRHSE